MVFPPERRQPGACGGGTRLLRYGWDSGELSLPLFRADRHPGAGSFCGGAGLAPAPLRFRGSGHSSGAAGPGPGGPAGACRVRRRLVRASLSPERPGQGDGAVSGCRGPGRVGEGRGRG